MSSSQETTNVYILHVNTCTNTDSLGGLKDSPKRKVWPYNLRREKKKSGDRCEDWPFFCFSIAELKTSHKLNSSAHCCPGTGA